MRQAVIEAGFSFIHDNEKKITRSRLFAISGYYDETGEYIARLECLTRIYQKLVRIVKKTAPYTEITDYIVSTHNNDYLQEREWKHKEYISASCLELKIFLVLEIMRTVLKYAAFRKWTVTVYDLRI